MFHLTKLSQMLNNIAWGIQDYLTPEYERSYTVDHERSKATNAIMYSFDYPPDVVSDLGRAYYWDLMNEIRDKPYIQRFDPRQADRRVDRTRVTRCMRALHPPALRKLERDQAALSM